jgi:hypothetical protein
MHIGTALFLIVLIWFAIAYPGFRKLLLVCAAIVAAVALIAIANHYDEASRQNATYRPTSITQPDFSKLHEVTDPDLLAKLNAPVPASAPPPPKPATNNELVNSILYGPSNYVPPKDKFVAGDEQHCPAGYAWDRQNRSCRLESSFRAVCVGPGC